MGFKTITAPTVEPIPIADCRQHLRLDLDGDLASETDVDEAEDALILGYLGAAREFAEGVLGVYLAPRTVEFTLDSFPCRRWFPLEPGPIRTIEAITYVDADGIEQDLLSSDFVIDDYKTPTTVVSARTAPPWPAVRCAPNAVKVLAIVGYGSISDTPPDVLPLPKDIRAALLLILAHLYENREDSTAVAMETIPNGALTMLGLKRENRGV